MESTFKFKKAGGGLGGRAQRLPLRYGDAVAAIRMFALVVVVVVAVVPAAF